MPTDTGIETRTVATGLVHWRSDALTTKLDLIRKKLDLIRTKLGLIRTKLDLIRTKLDLIREILINCHCCGQCYTVDPDHRTASLLEAGSGSVSFLEAGTASFLEAGSGSRSTSKSKFRRCGASKWSQEGP